MVADLAGLADVARAVGCRRRRCHHGHAGAVPADRVGSRHGENAVTKFIGGHGTSIGGAVVESGLFDGPTASSPTSPNRSPTYGGHTLVGELRRVPLPHPVALRTTPRRRSDDDPDQRVPVPAGALDAGPAHGGLHVAGARHRGACSWPSTRGRGGWSYAGLPDSPWHERALRYLPEGSRAVFSFGVLAAGVPVGAGFIEAITKSV